MKVSLWLGIAGRHTLRFDDIDVEEIAGVMQAVKYRQKIQVCDHRRNILGTWQAGELRQATAELSRISEGLS